MTRSECASAMELELTAERIKKGLDEIVAQASRWFGRAFKRGSTGANK